jgi:uncharacterized membrane protein YfhO
MKIPEGNHTIEYKFEPKVVARGSKISLATSILFLLVFLGAIFYNYRKKMPINE